jgi:cytochrome c551/c552
MKKVILWIVGIAVVFFLLIQLVPLDRSNPTPTRTVKWDSPQTQALAQRACLDCHSNETVWPWYSYVAPVSFLVTHDVKEGRENLNFSQWDQGAPEFDEIEEQIQRGSMPPPSYLPMHPTAKLSDAEKQQLIAGLEKTYQQDPTTIREGRGRGEGGGD